jgi:hypothetical protein
LTRTCKILFAVQHVGNIILFTYKGKEEREEEEQEEEEGEEEEVL